MFKTTLNNNKMSSELATETFDIFDMILIVNELKG